VIPLAAAAPRAAAAMSGPAPVLMISVNASAATCGKRAMVGDGTPRRVPLAVATLPHPCDEKSR